MPMHQDPLLVSNEGVTPFPHPPLLGLKKSISDPFFAQTSTSDPLFSAPIDFRGSGSQGAYLLPSLKEYPMPPGVTGNTTVTKTKCSYVCIAWCFHSSISGFNISWNTHLLDFRNFAFFNTDYIDGLVQDCSISIANALEILKSYTKPSIYDFEENFAQIHFPRWQLWLPRVVGQWDMSSMHLKTSAKWQPSSVPASMCLWHISPSQVHYFCHILSRKYQFPGSTKPGNLKKGRITILIIQIKKYTNRRHGCM